MTFREIEQAYLQWHDVLENRHIIAAVRNLDALTAVAKSPTEVVYLLFGNTLNVGDLLKRVRQEGKLPLVNLDLLSGFSRDAINAEYLAVSGAAGVVSTHGEVLRASRKQGLITVQRTFALDSAAIEAGLRTIHQFLPDAVEILPAVAAPRVLARFRDVHPALRVVAGGLIADLKEVEGLLAAGVDAVSISDPKFWVC
ncbi:MAG: glycerol-3-phosphate responsive antiterminator [Acidobacteriia bacterium]|nr:glycerol-3-phosphate responsive antiterminator [Terriglobia bacterium]MBV9742450.1 glycerol-3-phosphate responsive antiterminator [Terriglobia bacterium]